MSVAATNVAAESTSLMLSVPLVDSTALVSLRLAVAVEITAASLVPTMLTVTLEGVPVPRPLVGPRTPAERGAVNWGEVVSDAANGITDDFVLDLVANEGWGHGWLNQAMVFTGWHGMTPYIIGMADTSSGYQSWLSVPRGSRAAFLIHTPDDRFPKGATRAAQIADSPAASAVLPSTYFRVRVAGEDTPGEPWGSSPYDFIRFRSYRTNGGGGPWTVSVEPPRRTSMAISLPGLSSVIAVATSSALLRWDGTGPAQTLLAWTGYDNAHVVWGAKWAFAAAETRPGLIPQKTTDSPSASRSGSTRSRAASSSALVGATAVGPAQAVSSGSSATATNSSERYMFDQWNSRIGLTSVRLSLREARTSMRCASTRNAAPRTAAATG
mgnify:CR=1 FL=1